MSTCFSSPASMSRPECPICRNCGIPEKRDKDDFEKDVKKHEITDPKEIDPKSDFLIIMGRNAYDSTQ